MNVGTGVPRGTGAGGGGLGAGEGPGTGTGGPGTGDGPTVGAMNGTGDGPIKGTGPASGEVAGPGASGLVSGEGVVQDGEGCTPGVEQA